MKPPGLEFLPLSRLIMPSRVQDKIYEAVQGAIEAGMTVEQFRREAWECWDIVLDEMKKSADDAWARTNPGR